MSQYLLVSKNPIGILSVDAKQAKNAIYAIRGQISELGVKLPCRVRLFEKNSGRLIADVPTNDAGYYEIHGLVKVPFFIVAHHPTSRFNAVIQDNVVPK